MGPEQEASPALSGTGVEGGYSPEDLRKAYNLPTSAANGAARRWRSWTPTTTPTPKQT